MKRQAMKRSILTLLLGLAPAIAMATTLPARMPGLWQSTTTVIGPDGKPLPQASNVVTVSCVDAVTDAKFFTSNESACNNLAISDVGGRFAIDGTCLEQGRKLTIHETLVYSGPQAVTLDAVINSGGGPLHVSSRLQWEGACPAGMVPGDEGNMVDGAFSKADNINDADNR
jgi:hypothetical protein